MKNFEGRIVLICEECGERLVLSGPLSDWALGGTVFECECGEKFTLSGLADERKADRHYDAFATTANLN